MPPMSRKATPARVFLALLSLLAVLALLGLSRSPVAAQAGPTPLPTVAPPYAAQADLLFKSAYDQYQRGFPAGALNKLDQALFLYRQEGDLEGQISTLMQISAMLLVLQQPAEALPPLQEALDLRVKSGSHQNEVLILQMLAQVYAGQGKNALAQQCEARADALLKLGLAGPTTAGGDFYSSFTGQRKVEVESQLQYYHQALEVRKSMNDERGQAWVLLKMGWVFLNAQDYPQALQTLEQALDLARKAKDPTTEWQALNYLSWVYRELGQYPKSLEILTQALSVAKSAGDKKGIATLQSNLGVYYIEVGDFPDALAYMALSVTNLDDLESPVEKASAVHNLGSIYMTLGEVDQALAVFQGLLASQEKTGMRFERAYTLGEIGSIYVEKKDYARALSTLQEGLDSFPLTSDLTYRTIILTEMGRASQGLGKTDQALAYYDQAADLLERQRNTVAVEEFRISLASRWNDLYQSLVAGYLEAGQNERAFEITELARSRAFLDRVGSARQDIQAQVKPELGQQEQDLLAQLGSLEAAYRAESSLPSDQQQTEKLQKLAEAIKQAQDQYQELLIKIQLEDPRYASLVSVAPLKLKEIQALLDDQTTLVSYYQLPGQLAVFIIGADSFETRFLPYDDAAMQAAYEEIHRYDLDAPPASLAQLYTSLVAPLKPYLRSPKVGLIPYGLLHYLPFAAFQNGQTYFGDEHILFYLPSATAYAFIHQNEAGQVDGGAHPALVMAQGLAEGQPFLQYANQEAEAVAKALQSEPLEGQSATKANFLARAGQAGVIHLAAHGLLNTDAPLFSRLVLAADSSSASGDLEVREIYNLKLANASLVVLSACQTQQGARSQGDEIIGLNRAFIYAGAPTVVASLWPVNDQATMLLMEKFYAYLAQGLGAGEALQKAQQDVRAQFPHPYFWAAFVLNGEAGAVKPAAAPTGEPTPGDLQASTPALVLVATGCGAFLLLVVAALALVGGYLIWKKRSSAGRSRPAG